jgi:hypothetical protein
MLNPTYRSLYCYRKIASSDKEHPPRDDKVKIGIALEAAMINPTYSLELAQPHLIATAVDFPRVNYESIGDRGIIIGAQVAE